MDLLKDVIGTGWALLQLFWPIWSVALVVFLIKTGLAFRKKARLAQSGIADLDKQSGEDFERYLEILFRKLGYKVTRTPYQGDFGADLVLQQGQSQTVVQAKRYSRSVGVKAIQEAVAAKEYYRSDKAMVVTNSYYSQQAKKLAAANKVELWDRNELIERLLRLQETPAAVIDPAHDTAGQGSINPQPAVAEAICATCGKPVSAKVARFCANHQERFGGRIYCYAHQKAVRGQPAQAVQPQH